jgi:hypothetical protein
MTRATDKAESQARVRAAAMVVFMSKGWARATTREIARTAGRSTSHIYDHWGSLEALWRDVMGRDPPDVVVFARAVGGSVMPAELAASFLADWLGAEGYPGQNAFIADGVNAGPKGALITIPPAEATR